MAATVNRFETPDSVMTLDLRTAEGQSYVENLQRRDVSELGPSNRLLVVDTTAALSEHHEWFERLAMLPQVDAVVLVAIGTIDLDGKGPSLRTPSALANVGVTVWVGDGAGVPWQGGSRRPGAGRGAAGVDDLLTALRFPLVFDKVFAEVSEMPHQAANPGLAVDYATVEPAMMRALKLRALRQLVATGVAARQHDRESAELASVVRSAAEGDASSLRPGSPLHDAMTTAQSRVGAAARAMDALRGFGGLLGGVHRVVLARLAEAGEAVTRFHKATTRALEDVDSSLAEGYPSPAELVEQGLPSPAPVNSVELAESLRKAVVAELSGGRTLPGLADQARGLGNQLGAARSLVVAESVDAEIGSWIGKLVKPPAFRLWPTPVMHLLPVVFVTCLLAAWVPGLQWWRAIGLGLLWLLSVALLFNRAPGVQDARLPLAATALAAAASGTAGTFFPALPSFGLFVAIGVLLVLMAVLVGSVVAVWNRAVTTWAGEVPVRRAARANRLLVDQVTRTIEERWTPSDRNRRLADALLVIAGAIDAVVEVFGDMISDQREQHDGSTLSVDSSAGLAEVLHHDLVAITLEVLRPSFDEISSRTPLSGDSQRSLLRAQDLAAEYNHHLDHAGLRELPPFVTDDGPRRRLAAALWQSSDASRRVLSLTARSLMTQLCAAEDIRLLQADGTVVVHFASSDMDLPPADGGVVIRTRGDAVGAIRLTPLVNRIVQREVHVVAPGPEGDAG